MPQLILLKTQDGTQYPLIQEAGGFDAKWCVKYTAGYRVRFLTLKKTLHELGGVVAWDAWSEAARETLRALNDGQPI